MRSRSVTRRSSGKERSSPAATSCGRSRRSSLTTTRMRARQSASGRGRRAGTTRIYLVVADGEGVQGGGGTTGNQLAHFFKDTLHATAATCLDSGLSTEMVLKGSSGLRHVSTITGEDGRIQLDPFREVLTEGAGFAGSVAAFLSVRGSQIVVGP